MTNRLLISFQRTLYILNQLIDKLVKNRQRQKKIAFNILLSFTCCLVVTFLGMAINQASIENTVEKVTKIATEPKLNYQTSWIGNSIGKGKLAVQNYIEAMYVTENGKIYTNSTWDEAAVEAGIYQDGKIIGALEDTHGWHRLGGKAIAVNSKYIYLAMIQGGMNRQGYPPEGEKWYCVRRYHLNGKPAPFANGKGWDKSMLIISKKSEITGLATLNNKLFVSNAEDNFVRVFNLVSMQEINKFQVNNPGQIAIDKKDSLWIIENKKDNRPAKIVHYNQTGKKLPEEIVDIDNPIAISTYKRNQLLVADNGINQQVLIYNIKNKPFPIETVGEKNGIYSGIAGEVQDLKLYGISAVGTDKYGYIYINNNGFNNSGTDLRKISSEGKMQWQLLGLIFVDNADTDPESDGINLFTKQEKYVMDYSQPAGKQWNYQAYTLNPFKYPQDPRLHTSPDGTIFRRIQGRPFLFLTDMYNTFLQFYRFQPKTEGEIAIPATMFVETNVNNQAIQGNWPPYQPTQGEWIWRDKNGNGKFEKNEYDSSKDYPYLGGWWVDSKGDVWKALRTKNGIRHYPFQGLDQNGNPIYTYSSMEKQTSPNFFSDLRRIEYFPETDTMYLSGFTFDHPSIGDDAKVVGSEIARFDNWSQGNRTPKWRTVVPYDITGEREIATAAMSVAGDYVFAVTFKTAEVYVYKATTGKLVYKFAPGPEVDEESGWVDIPYGIRAFRRQNGEYLVFVEENWKGKVLVYRLPI